MHFGYWIIRMIRDVVLLGFVNDAFATSIAILMFLTIGLLILGAQVSAPFIYTLF